MSENPWKMVRNMGKKIAPIELPQQRVFATELFNYRIINFPNRASAEFYMRRKPAGRILKRIVAAMLIICITGDPIQYSQSLLPSARHDSHRFIA